MAASTKRVDVIVVEHAGEKLIVPESLTDKQAIDVLTRKMEYDEQTVQINAPISGFVFDAAHAFFRVCQNKFGWVNNVPTPGFFSDKPPALLTVPISRTESVQVPWGRMVLPGIEGYLETGADFRDGQFVFVIGGVVKRKHEKQVLEIVALARDYLREKSVYKGQAFRLRLLDEDGSPKPLPEPKFLELDPKIETELIFSAEVRDSIQTNIFTVIERTAKVRALGVPLKRGILLSGPYGTGKSMTSTVTAVKAVRNGWTYIVCERADELGQTLRLAREWGPAVVFCEDIDRVMAGQRSIDMDEVLNIIDGVESKSAELMVVLTTNDVDKIHQAMLRPGRLDAVIHVAPPDAAAAEKLMRHYGRGLIADDEDLTAAAQLMSGQIPAVIREVVERSKLAALGLVGDDEAFAISGEAMLAAAHSMRNQLALLAPRQKDERSDRVKSADLLGAAIRDYGETVAEALHANGNGRPVNGLHALPAHAAAASEVVLSDAITLDEAIATEKANAKS